MFFMKGRQGHGQSASRQPATDGTPPIRLAAKQHVTEEKPNFFSTQICKQNLILPRKGIHIAIDPKIIQKSF
jgi:hypothetical protein